MELQKHEIEQFCDIYHQISGKAISLETGEVMAKELLELMKILTENYESYIDPTC